MANKLSSYHFLKGRGYMYVYVLSNNYLLCKTLSPYNNAQFHYTAIRTHTHLQIVVYSINDIICKKRIPLCIMKCGKNKFNVLFYKSIQILFR